MLCYSRGTKASGRKIGTSDKVDLLEAALIFEDPGGHRVDRSPQ